MLKKTCVILVAALAVLPLRAAVGVPNDAPSLIDFTHAANRDLEDDGIADNGKGGWTDEGVNDFFVYPPLHFGLSTWRGTPFRLLDPKRNAGHAVIMLRGGTRMKDLPHQVAVPVGSAKGKYLYVLHTSAGRPVVEPGNLVATYILTYDDKSSVELPVRNGVEIQQWYVGQWWDNHGSQRYPVYMGRNCYSGRWNQWVGLWASQWANPHPEKPIASITFASAGADVPIIFAATIANTDYAALRDDGDNKMKRPDDVPEGFFDAKLEAEHQRILSLMTEQHIAQGIRSVEMIKPDLLALTVDSALGGIAVGAGEKVAAAYEVPENFSVKSSTDQAFASGVHPARVGRQTRRVDTCDVGPFKTNAVFWHTFYLQLPGNLTNGNAYRITLANLPAPYKSIIDFTCDDATITPAIKVNQVAYSVLAKKRYAYLGWWASDLGAVDFAAYKSFRVIDEQTHAEILHGTITPRDTQDKWSGENVFEMDLSPLPEGRYHIVVPGLGRSVSFAVGGQGVRDLYFNTMRAFLHQRCGCELTPAITDWPRPACHVEVYENKHLVENHPSHRPDEPIKKFTGGYHDAGDFDTFASHLPATAQSLTGLELFPAAFGDHDLNLPESGHGIPDILSEAAWALRFDAATQQEDGAILFGRANDCDSLRQVPLQLQLPYGLFAPKNVSTNAFAATAAQFAKLLRPYDAAEADRMLDRACRAYGWAKAHQPAAGSKDEQEKYWQLTWAWAAAELFDVTGGASFNDDFKTLYRAKAIQGDWQLGQRGDIYTWRYIVTKQPSADPEIQAKLRGELIKSADWVVKNTSESAYRMGRGKGGGGWGTLVGGGYYGDVCIRAYALTHDQQYLDAASLNADFQLGANPIGMSFITGMGTRFPQNPELNPALKAGLGKTVKGISIYGPGGGISGYPKTVPPWRCYEDNATSAANSEFTITETVGPAAILYESLWALQATK